jgi:prepilin-type processing-associated H-X9-DG protein
MVCNFKISKKMKKNIVYSVLMLALAGCYKVPEQKGFLSNDLYLKGADTINLALGSKGNSNVAWLDGSSEPCLFTLENIRDKNGNRSEQFFTKYPYNTWIKPYDNKTTPPWHWLRQRSVPRNCLRLVSTQSMECCNSWKLPVT